jgi:hypothetical protein
VLQTMPGPPPDAHTPPRFSDPVIALARFDQEFDGWAPAQTALITESRTQPTPRPIQALPVEHR